MDVLKATTTYDAAMTRPSVRAAAQAAIAESAREWIERSRGPWTWQVRADWLHLLEGRDAPDWSHLPDDPRAQLVKTNDGRQVWRVQLGAQLVFVKIGRPARRWALLRRLAFGTDASRERGVAEYAATRGIETVTPVAMAAAPINGRDPVSILITVGLPRAQSLNEFWTRLDPGVHTTRRVKNEVISAAARLIAEAHQCGLEHTDLHAGNVLVEANGHGTYRALFVDLQNIRTGRVVDDETAIRNLAQFNQWFRLHAPLTDRIRFLDQYLAWRDRLRGGSSAGRSLTRDRRGLLPALERAACDHANALYGKRDRRALRTGRYFARLRLGDGWHAHVFLESKHAVEGSPASSARFTIEQWKTALARPQEWARGDHRQYVIKDSPTALVYRTQVTTDRGQAIDVVCKRAIPRSLVKKLALLVRPSRPMLTWLRGNALLNRQVPTARPLAVVERRRFGRTTDAFIITEHVEHAHDLDAVLTIHTRDMSDAAAHRFKCRLTESLVATLRRLHERGFTHRDLKAPNIIVQWDEHAESPPHTLLVDLDGVRQVRRPNADAEIRALARLNVSLDHCRRVTRADRARFLKRYLARPGRPEPDWRPVWERIRSASSAKRAIREN